MKKLIAHKNNHALVEIQPGFYAFGHEKEFASSFGFPVNQCGTLDEVKAELERWKNEVDNDNPFMLSIEMHFLDIINKIQGKSK